MIICILNFWYGCFATRLRPNQAQLFIIQRALVTVSQSQFRCWLYGWSENAFSIQQVNHQCTDRVACKCCDLSRILNETDYFYAVFVAKVSLCDCELCDCWSIQYFILFAEMVAWPKHVYFTRHVNTAKKVSFWNIRLFVDVTTMLNRQNARRKRMKSC